MSKHKTNQPINAHMGIYGLVFIFFLGELCGAVAATGMTRTASKPSVADLASRWRSYKTKDKDKRGRIVAKLREYAEYTDKITLNYKPKLEKQTNGCLSLFVGLF